MPDASTQTTKGKKIFLIKKPVSMGLRLKLVKVWFDKTYKDWWPWNMCLDMCEEDFGISINAESNPDISDYLHTLYKENQPVDSSDDEKSKFLYPERCQKYWNVELQKHEWRQYLGAGQFCEPKRIL